MKVIVKAWDAVEDSSESWGPLIVAFAVGYVAASVLSVLF